ncbi:MAG: CPBP family intramembrane metalloprotease [Ignavibacteriaceae bacterium]|nr:CPBP family intramembrane metalloprotease [Ignavibacteriaceae bacterium]
MFYSDIIKDIKRFFAVSKELDRKPVIIFMAVAVLQTVSWYYTSRTFFIQHLREYFIHSEADYLKLFEFLYWFVGDFITNFVVPLLLIKILFREKGRDYGVTMGDFKSGMGYTGVSLMIMLPLVWYASTQQEFLLVYPHLLPARDSWQMLLWYETGMLLYMISWEFIWRGFMLFGLYPKFGYYAVLIQMIPFLILHNGKPALETFSAIAGGIALGAIALRTGSFIYGVMIHFAIMFTIDILAVLRYKTGDYGLTPASFVNLLVELFKGLK